jgi:hypothetical protein
MIEAKVYLTTEDGQKVEIWLDEEQHSKDSKRKKLLDDKWFEDFSKFGREHANEFHKEYENIIRQLSPHIPYEANQFSLKIPQKPP